MVNGLKINFLYGWFENGSRGTSFYFKKNLKLEEVYNPKIASVKLINSKHTKKEKKKISIMIQIKLYIVKIVRYENNYYYILK